MTEDGGRPAGRRLSVVAIVRDEERNLPEFLATHRFADEIVLVDSGSTDRTEAIASADPKVRFLHHDWEGFPRQWNHALDHATGDWILISEADHRASELLEREIEEVLAGRRRGGAFLVPRRNYIFGRWLRHGGCWPDYCYPRLFRRGAARFDESKAIHEKLQVPGSASVLKGHFDHHSIDSIDQYLAKMAHYTSIEARQYLDLARRHGSRLAAARAIVFNRSLPARQRLSYLRPLIPFWPVLSFLRRYVLQLGFLDGRAGFLFCFLSSVYELTWREKVRELERRR